MAKLSKKEQEAFEALKAKAEAPERDNANTRLNVNLDLGDEAQVARAVKLGFLDLGDEDEDENDDDDGDEPPVRKGYFKE